MSIIQFLKNKNKQKIVQSKDNKFYVRCGKKYTLVGR